MISYQLAPSVELNKTACLLVIAGFLVLHYRYVDKPGESTVGAHTLDAAHVRNAGALVQSVQLGRRAAVPGSQSQRPRVATR